MYDNNNFNLQLKNVLRFEFDAQLGSDRQGRPRKESKV